MPKSPKSSKQLRAHFARRFWGRYPGLALPSIEWIEAQIQKNSDAAEFQWRQSLARSHWKVLIDGVWVPVVYDNKRKCVVTCLSAEMANT